MDLYDKEIDFQEDRYYIKNTDSKTIIKTNNIDEIEITPAKFYEMVKIYNFFQIKKFNKMEFKSKNHIGRTIENVPEASTFIRSVIDDMLKMKLIFVNKDDKYFFDSLRFEELVEHIQYGKSMIQCVENMSLIRV